MKRAGDRKENIREAEEAKKLFAQESLILDVTEAIWEVMEKRGINKAQLAENLGTSKAYITQLLDGSRNMTLRTLADVSYSLGLNVKFRFCEKQEVAVWENTEIVITHDTKQTFETIVANDQLFAPDNWFEPRAAQA